MELKYYDKPWLPAFKGAFLIIFGLIAMLQIFGTLKTLAVFFVALIGMMAILLIGSGGGSGESTKTNTGQAGAAGAGLGIEPLGFLVSRGDEISMVSISRSKGIQSVFEKVPDLLEKLVEAKMKKDSK